MVMADAAWSGFQANPMTLSIAQTIIVTPSQYLIAAGELQQALRRSSIGIPPCHYQSDTYGESLKRTASMLTPARGQFSDAQER
jgi:hypothetical protein